MIFVGLLCTLPTPGAAADVYRIGVRSAEIAWDEPSNAIIDGYFVSVSLNGAPEQFVRAVDEPRFTIEADYGDNVVVTVRTLGRALPNGSWQISEPSPPSPRIHFVASPETTGPAEGLLTLHCAECQALEVRDFSNALPPEILPGHGYPWEVVAIGDIHATPGLEVVWYDPSTGDLEVIGLGDGLATPLAAGYLALGDRVPVGLVDTDGNGLAEIVVRRGSKIEFWRTISNTLQPAGDLFVPLDYELLSGEDFDGDGTGDLWWWTPDDQLEVWKLLSPRFFTTLLAMSNPGAGWVTQIGDFDGDGTPDALWRNSFGLLQITHLGPAADSSSQPFDWLPGDQLREVRAVADLDGTPGVEILVQHEETLAVDVIYPLGGPGRDRLIDMTEPWLLVDARNE